MVSGMKSQQYGVRVLASVLLTVSILSSIQVHAQFAGGTISGTVTDPSGGVVPNAQVRVENAGTGVVRSAATNEAGIYGLPNLEPATYEITFSAPGFGATVVTDIR